MAPSFAKLGAAAVACAASAAAAADVYSYKLSDSYNADNFFSKFNFFTAPDPTNGFVQYQSQSEADRLGLIAKQGDEIFIGVDHSSQGPEVDGRKSVRIESKDKFDTGLIIGKFTHFPKPVCGAWPAFWTFGDVWPTDGEIDIYEMWNLASHNLLTYHTGKPEDVGECWADNDDFSGVLKTENCWNDAPGQYSGQGCGAEERNGQWGSQSGGVYATDIQPEAVRIWSWPRDQEPQDVKDGKPDPSTWGKPHFSVESSDCDISRAFRRQKIVLNIAFCGGATESNWNQQCSIITEGATCVDWVRNNPDAFADVFWKISYINIYERQTATPSSSAVVSSSATPSSSAVASSSATFSPYPSVSTFSVDHSITPSSTFSPYPSVSTFSVDHSILPSSTFSPYPSISTFPVDHSIISSLSASASSVAAGSSAVPSSVAASSSSAVPSSAAPSDSGAASSEAPAASSSVAPGSSASASASASITPAPSGTVSYPPGATASESESDCEDYPEETETVTATASEDLPVSSDYPVVETSSAAPVSETTSCSETETATATEAPVSETSSCTDTETVTATETEAPVSETSSCSETETATVTETESEVPVSTAGPETTEYTTSTVYSTSTYTVTSCSTTVTDCPHNGGSYTKTEVVPVYTTVCPVEKTTSPGPIVPGTTTAEEVYGTTTATTTLQLTTTAYLPEESTEVPAPVEVPSGKPYIPGHPSGPAFPYPGVNSTLATLAPQPTGGYSASKPVYVPTVSVTTPEQVQETAPVTAGASKGSVGALVMLVAGVAAMLL